MAAYNMTEEQAKRFLDRPWNDCTGFGPFLETVTTLTNQTVICDICGTVVGTAPRGKVGNHFYCSEECLEKAFAMHDKEESHATTEATTTESL